MQIGKIAPSRAATTPRSSASPPRPRSTRMPTKSTSPTATAIAASSCRRDDRRLQAALGRYGKPPTTTSSRPTTQGPVSQQFANPVHCVKVANDGLVYVCDRINNRIQVFRKDGTFVKEFFFGRTRSATARSGTSRSGPIRTDLYLSADGENNEIRVIKREDGSVVGSSGRNGRNAGQFHWVHAMAVDARATFIPPRSIPEKDPEIRINLRRATLGALPGQPERLTGTRIV